MALDFPASPTTNQQFTAGGLTWQWDGVKWVALVGGTGPALAPINNPVFTGDPQVPLTAVGDNDTSIANTQFVTRADANLNATSNVGRNLLHNAMWTVQQRAIVTGWFEDRWQTFIVSPDFATFNLVAMSDTDKTQIGDEEARYQPSINCTGGAGSTSMGQRLETLRRFVGKTCFISFWAKAATGTPRLGVSYQENFGATGSASVSGNIFTTPALTSTWTRYFSSVTFPSAVGKSYGTAGTDYLEIDFWFNGGGALSGNIPIQSGDVRIWGPQLEFAQPGQTAPTPLDKVSYDDDLRHCQRFFYAGVPPLRGVISSATAVGRLACLHPVTMRAAPSVSTAAGVPIFDGTAVSTVTGISNYSTTTVLEFDGSGATGMTVGRPAIIYQGAGGNLYVSAEL